MPHSFYTSNFDHIILKQNKYIIIKFDDKYF